MKNFVYISIIFLFASCGKKTSWESEWSAPLINDTLTLKDWVNDSTLSSSNGVYYNLELNRQLFELGINDILKIHDTLIEENFTIAVPSITVAPGFSFVNSAEEHDLNMDGAEIQQIILSTGKVDITVENPVETKANFKVKLPGVTKNNVTLDETFTAPAATSSGPGIVHASIDLSGYTIDLRGFNGDSYNILQSQITVTSDPLGPTVTMTSADVTKVKAEFTNVKVMYARGYLGMRVFEEVKDIYADFLDIYESGYLDLPQLSATFQIENGFKISAQGVLNSLVSENSNGTLVSLTGGVVGNNVHIDPATGSWSSLTPSLQSFTFSNANSNIENFLENFGRKYYLDFNYEMNPWGNVSASNDEVFPLSKIKARLNVNMPLIPGMDQLTLRDTFAVDIAPQTGNVQVKSGKLFLNANNAFPISAKIKLVLLDDNNDLLAVIDSDELIQSSKMGTFNPSLNLNVCESNLMLDFPEDLLDQVEKIKKIVVRSELNTYNPASGINEPLAIPVDAFISIKLRTQFVTENSF